MIFENRFHMKLYILVLGHDLIIHVKFQPSNHPTNALIRNWAISGPPQFGSALFFFSTINFMLSTYWTDKMVQIHLGWTPLVRIVGFIACTCVARYIKKKKKKKVDTNSSPQATYVAAISTSHNVHHSGPQWEIQLVQQNWTPSKLDPSKSCDRSSLL